MKSAPPNWRALVDEIARLQIPMRNGYAWGAACIYKPVSGFTLVRHPYPQSIMDISFIRPR